MMQSLYSKSHTAQALMTLENILQTIDQIIIWNQNVGTTEDYYGSQSGMQLLAANCTLITAIGEGINRVNRMLPDFLSSQFPEVPWRAIIGMRNHIAHGYFELDADIVFDAVKNDIPVLNGVILSALDLLKSKLEK